MVSRIVKHRRASRTDWLFFVLKNATLFVMKPETIKAIFTNLLFVIGVILLIWGISKAALTGARLVTFDKYPLAGYEETRCEYASRPVIEEKNVNVSPDMLTAQRASCEESVERNRKTRQVEDIVQSIVLPLSGLALVYFFRRYILK